MPNNRTSSNPVTHRDSDNVETIFEYRPINTWETPLVRGQLRARIVKRKGKSFLDIREYHEGQTFNGWTKRGLRLSGIELRVLEDIIADAKERLVQNATARGEEQWQEPSSATDTEGREHVST